MIGVQSDCKNRFQSEKLKYLIEKTYHRFNKVRDMKNEKKETFLNEALSNESVYQGGYRKIFPCDNQVKYLNYMKDAKFLYSNTIKAKPKNIEEKPAMAIRRSVAVSHYREHISKTSRRKSCAARVSIMPKIVYLNLNS